MGELIITMKDYRFSHYKRRLGDRYDGWRVRNVDPVFRVIPYFLRTRIDSQNFYEERLPIDYIEQFIKNHKDDMPDLSIMHVFMAALVRLMSQRPYLNRFVIWNKIFARNHVNISFVVKRSLTSDGEETLIKPYFKLEDTLQNVVIKVNEELKKNQPIGQKNGTDKFSIFVGYLPDFIFRIVVFCFYWLDKIGILPPVINHISPWHCSAFVTNIGSIGVESIYHHLYEFGTCSMFMAMGKKNHKYKLDKDGNTNKHKSIVLKFVLDERVCDGYYYASSMRLLNKILANPEQLLLPPKTVVVDDGVRRKRADI